MRSVSVIIPTWNGRELLAEFLPSVFAALDEYRDRHAAAVELLVVDDASTDDTLDWLRATHSEQSALRVVALAENLGFLRAVNRGFAEARHDIIFLLNNDVRVEADAIAPLVGHFDDGHVFAVCSKAYRLGTDFLDGAGKLGRFERGFWRVFLNYDILPTRLPAGAAPFPSFFASGGYVAYDAQKLATLGGFCEWLAPNYWEDVEICYRAWKRGWSVAYEPASVVHHVSSATLGDARQHRVRLITERNRLLMTWIHLHDPAWFAAHLAWLGVKLMGAAVSLDRDYWRSFRQALARLRPIRQLRRQEKAAARRSDRELAAIFTELAASAWVAVMRNVKDYDQYLRLRRELETDSTQAVDHGFRH
ncbi:MAG TPA: glycosyltransferase family 2 protein [Blastocatellia bacterium]|nr:glycosyltransferase family 2 protein [Blastocatellia bacterium]